MFHVHHNDRWQILLALCISSSKAIHIAWSSFENISNPLASENDVKQHQTKNLLVLDQHRHCPRPQIFQSVECCLFLLFLPFRQVDPHNDPLVVDDVCEDCLVRCCLHVHLFCIAVCDTPPMMIPLRSFPFFLLDGNGLLQFSHIVPSSMTTMSRNPNITFDRHNYFKGILVINTSTLLPTVLSDCTNYSPTPPGPNFFLFFDPHYYAHQQHRNGRN